MADEVSIYVGQIQALVKEIKKDGTGGEALTSLADKLLDVIAKIPPLDQLQPTQAAVGSKPKLESCAITLWNLAVAKKTGGGLTPSLNAKLRHIAFRLVYLSQPSDADERTLNKQIMMAVKTARAWLDCDSASMADNPLSVAAELLERLFGLIKNLHSALDGSGDALPDELGKKRQAIEKDHFRILCYKAEAAMSQGQKDTAVELISQARELLISLPQEATYLGMLCFNLGVETFQRGDYETSVAWLRQSFDIGKNKNAVSSQNQARTLRLLANAYLEWDGKQHWQKALNAIGLANAEHNHPAGLYLKLRIFLEGDAPDDRLGTGMEEVLRHPELTVNLAITAIRLVFKHGRYNSAFEGLQQLTLKFEGSPELGAIWCTHLELLLSSKKMEEARDLLERLITANNTGKEMDGPTKKQFHLLIWEQAAQRFESKDFDEALQWYNYSLSLFSTLEDMDTNLSKLHRNRAACFIALHKPDKAGDAIVEAERRDPASAHTYYLMYKVALMQSDTDKALESLQKMSDCGAKVCEKEAVAEISIEQGPSIHGLICMAAQLAMEQSNRQVAVQALEGLVQHSTSVQEVLTAIRCLTRLRLTLLDQQDNKKDTGTIVSYIKLAYEKLSTLSEQGNATSVSIQDEATWFMKMSWNLGLQCDDSVKELHESFLICCKLTRLCLTDISSLVRQKTCLLMATAAVLQMAKDNSDPSEKSHALHQALSHITECRTICDKIDNAKVTQPDNRAADDTPALLLILYEFEAKARLGSTDLEKILEQAIALPNADAKAFETIAALAMESQGDNKSVSTRALKVAIKKHLQASRVDYTRCSKTFHSLVALALQGGSASDPVSVDEAWGYYMDVIDIIENSAKGSYPEMEVLWLMTKAWNCGIHLYSATKYKDALRWCELGMRLLKHLGSLHSNYSPQMTSVYGEILSKVDAFNGAAL